ncbi:hypothetical protein VN97_g6838 [Penicillium thymicola]|uniref:Uncharacterized protein n=1 Tax=Penicillium thymicola TaxID=293382 RepID=A0AAI9X790_PENTH|nr:hypothetical protein VN97_g6838 [Penicillium thymicola]
MNYCIGNVNIVIIVSVNRTTPNIKFETISLEISSLRYQRRSSESPTNTNHMAEAWTECSLSVKSPWTEPR